MGLLIWRDMTVMVRTRGFWLAMTAYILLVAAFVIVWGEGVPVLDGTVFDQGVVVQLGLLSVVLSWTAARCSGSDQRRSLVLESVTTATRPSRLVAAKCIALSAGLAILVVAAIPL